MMTEKKTLSDNARRLHAVRKGKSEMKFIVDLWMDGYSSEEEMNAACKEFIKEQLDFTATSVQIEEYAASRDSRILSAMPSEEEIEKLGDEYVAGFADEYKGLAKINFINGFKRGIAG